VADREPTQPIFLVPSRRIIKEIREGVEAQRAVVEVDFPRKAIDEIENNIAGVALDTLKNETGEKYRRLITAAFRYNERRLREAAEKINTRMNLDETIVIGEIRKPIVHVIPDSERFRLKVSGELIAVDKANGNSGYFLGHEDMAVVASNGDFESEADTVSHEISHGLGRYLLRYKLGDPIGNKPRFASSWTGLGYEFLWRGQEHIRGILFEEALAVERGCGFMSSDELNDEFPELVRKTKKKYQPNSGEANVRQVEAEYGARGECAMYWKIMDRMVLGIEQIEGRDACTRELLALGRIEPKLLVIVRDQCDRVYGKGTFWRLWRLGNTKGEGLEAMLAWLDLGGVEHCVERGLNISDSLVDQIASEISPSSRIGRQLVINNTRRVWNRMLVTPESSLNVDFIRRLLKISQVDNWMSLSNIYGC
jgi:hypothetical protein